MKNQPRFILLVFDDIKFILTSFYQTLRKSITDYYDL